MSAHEQDRSRWPFLPALLFWIAEAFGLDVALRFADRFGGQRITVPAVSRPNHPIIREFGPEMADRVRAFASEKSCEGQYQITVPVGPKGAMAGRQRMDAVATMMAADMKPDVIAKMLGIHVRTVWRMRARAVASAAHQEARRQRLERKP